MSGWYLFHLVLAFGIACKLVRPKCLATHHSSCTVSGRNNFASMTMSSQEMFTCVFIMVSELCHNEVNMLRDAISKADLSLRLLHMKVGCLPNQVDRKEFSFKQQQQLRITMAP